MYIGQKNKYFVSLSKRFPDVFMSSNQTLHTFIESIKKGDKRPFDRLYLAERKPFLRWVKKQYDLPEEESVELYQQVMMLLYENIVQGKLSSLKSDLKTYFYGIAKKLMLKDFRKQDMRRKHADKLHEHWKHHWVEEDESFQQMRYLVKRLFLEIKESCRALLGLYYFENQAVEDIVQRLGFKNKAVLKVQKHRCLNYLKEMVLQKLKTTDKHG